MNGVIGEKKVTHRCHTVQTITTESGWYMVLTSRILVAPLPDPPTRETSTNLIVIFFINRKHHSVCGSWGQGHQCSSARCAHYKWSNKLSLSAKNFHNWFQPQGTFCLFLNIQPFWFMWMWKYLHFFLFLLWIQSTEYYLAQGKLQNSWTFSLI